MTRRIAIVGGGVSGFASALKVQALDPAADVFIYEQDDRLGGKLKTEHYEGFVIEHGPDAFLSSKPGGVHLTEHLGLTAQAISPRPENRGSFILRNGSLLPIPDGLSGLVPGDIKAMLRSPLLSWPGRARMAAEYVVPQRKDSSDESIASFMVRRYGHETWERMIEPLLTGIYGGNGSELSLDATFPQLRTQERVHGSLLKAAMAKRREMATHGRPAAPRAGFLSFRDGMRTLIDQAAEQVTANGGAIATCTSAQHLSAADDGRFDLTLRNASGTHTERFDGVVIAIPAWAAATLLCDVAPVASTELGSIEHGSSGLVTLGFPASQLTRPLNGYGYVVPRVEQRDATAMTWSSQKWAGRAPEGQVLLRVFVGRVGREEVLQRDDADLVAVALREISDVLGMTVQPSFSRVQRWMSAMPQYTLGHLDRVNRMQQALGQVHGVEVAGPMFRGVGIPDAITSGETAASNLITDLAARISRAENPDDERDAVLAARALFHGERPPA